MPGWATCILIVMAGVGLAYMFDEQLNDPQRPSDTADTVGD